MDKLGTRTGLVISTLECFTANSTAPPRSLTLYLERHPGRLPGTEPVPVTMIPGEIHCLLCGNLYLPPGTPGASVHHLRQVVPEGFMIMPDHGHNAPGLVNTIREVGSHLAVEHGSTKKYLNHGFPGLFL